MTKAARLACAALLTPLASLPLSAAEAPDLAVGYSLVNLDEQSRHGAAAALSFAGFGRIRLWVDASSQRGTESGVDLDVTTLMAGPGTRFGKGGTRLFLRALAGLVRQKASISVLDAEISETESGLGALAGGGVDLRLSGRLGLRLLGDYLWRDADTGSASGWRAGAGIVYRFGAAQ